MAHLSPTGNHSNQKWLNQAVWEGITELAVDTLMSELWGMGSPSQAAGKARDAAVNRSGHR